MIKKKIKKALVSVKRFFSVKTPIKYPVMSGDYLNGRTALITGGGSGIGYAIAESFVRNGASVIICGRNMAKLGKAAERLKRIPSLKGNVFCVQLDVADIEQTLDTLTKVVKEHSIDILINNAGTDKAHSVGATNCKDFETIMETNLEGTYFVSQFFLNYMRKNEIQGNILNVASSSSIRPAASPYAISKWGILGFTKGLAKVAIRDGIVVNGIAPGPTATEMLNKTDTTDVTLKSSPIGRYIMPEEIANLCTILVSDMGKTIIGDTIFATGGAATVTFDDVEY